jgi:ribonuclease P/MRP protein subunit POP5
VKYFSPTTSTGIVRVGREQYRLVWAALTFLKEIKGQPCIISVVHVSGTIKKAEIEAMKRANRAIQQVSVEQREDMMLDETMTDDNVES